ncbi:VOC family protein [Limnobacter sp.]|uniref:VOC family protein n=1 Tax=Limnobacter sp. TaxID=2003368 RepID=UPI0025C18CC5|nr:VOC family protein [Limnobacter sp.]
MSKDIYTDLFGQVQMGYAVIESMKSSEWKLFLKQGLGLHAADDSETTQRYRIDSHACRLLVSKGKEEDIQTIGYQIANEHSLNRILARCEERNLKVEKHTGEEAQLRGVDEFHRLTGPKGLGIELYVNAQTCSQPLNMLNSGFVTGPAGMGHVAMTSRQPIKVQRFYQEFFDARLSDRIHQPMAGGVMLDIAFLRLNERHHSVAIAATRGLRLDPIRTKVQHMNLQVASMDDLSNSFRRCKDLGFEMAHEIGQHPNDLELSFYVITPSGFEMELGWDALAVNEANWTPADYPHISVWGHKPQKAGPLDLALLNLGNFRRGVSSLIKPEYSPI